MAFLAILAKSVKNGIFGKNGTFCKNGHFWYFDVRMHHEIPYSEGSHDG